jgi:hypothetical protein
VKVNNARPLLAFWLLALAAAVIALLGLRAGAGAEVRTDTPTQHVTSAAQPAPAPPGATGRS